MNLRAYWRFFVVLWQFFPLLITYARDRRRFLLFGRSRQVEPEQRRRRASKLLDSVVTLGPTFVKLGQLLSTRPDVLPPEYITEFSKLQDRVPPAAWEDARVVIESELGPVDEEFDSFEVDAIQGASLGQVYKAEVDGKPVAVKVRRPGVEARVEADLRVVRWSLPILMQFVDEARSFSLETLAEEFDTVIRQEMDYKREAKMLREIRSNFTDDPHIRMPEVVETHSTGRVLTMEYLKGTKITNIERLDELGLDRSLLAERLQRTYLQMILEDGVFHADPHPGNISVTDDGALIFYDFGMSGYVDPYFQEKIVDFYIAIARRDIDAILDALIEMGTLSPKADRQVMGEIMELAIVDLSGEDIEQYRIQQIVQQVEDTIYEFPLRLPSNLALVLRVATVVEGVCVTLDPDFDFITVATEYLGSRGYLEEGLKEYIETRGDELRDAADSSLRIPPKLEASLDRINREDLTVNAELSDSEDHFDRQSKQLVYGMLVAAGIVSTTVLYATNFVIETALLSVFTIFFGIILYRSYRDGRGIQAHPQFTRQRMRKKQSQETVAIGFGDALAESEERGSSSGEPNMSNRSIKQERPESGSIDITEGNESE